MYQSILSFQREVSLAFRISRNISVKTLSCLLGIFIQRNILSLEFLHLCSFLIISSKLMLVLISSVKVVCRISAKMCSGTES